MKCPHCNLDDMIEVTSFIYHKPTNKELWHKIFCNRCGLESKVYSGSADTKKTG